MSGLFLLKKKVMSETGSLLSFYSKMALKGDPSAQLEAAKVFDRYSEDGLL